MQENELIEKIKELVQMDIDTVHAYNRALDEISDKIMRSRLTAFRDNHQNHIADLSYQIRILGGQAPEPTKDFKGFILEAFTALRIATGTKGALKALKTVEEITNRYYGNVVSETVPEALKDMLRRHFSDEKIHLDYISSNLQAL